MCTAMIIMMSLASLSLLMGFMAQSVVAFSPPAFSTRAEPSATLLFHNKKKKPRKKASGQGFGGSGNGASDSFPYAGSVRPGIQSPQRSVTEADIRKPDYHSTGQPTDKPSLLPWLIEVKDAQAIKKMRASGLLARQVLDMAGQRVKPGVTTDEIDTAVHEMVVKSGAYPSPLNYHGFPKSCCTSVNEVICHGIPDDRPLQEGDIVNIDITVYLDGYHGDCSEMFYVGQNPDTSTRKLLQTTYDSWIAACNFVQEGRDYKDIGGLIEDTIGSSYSTVRNFCGHGIGSVFHTNPNILHYRNSEPNGQMAVGHTFTIEPMICEGSAKALSWPDNWTATTVDGKRSAQFEHTLLVCPDGVEALTGKTEDSPLQFWEKESTVHTGIWLGTTSDAIQRQASINDKKLASLQ